MNLAGSPNLTLEDMDWLRRIRAASKAKRHPPSIPTSVTGKLRAFGLVAPNDPPEITDRGDDALLEQKMRDAEDR
jgi:hypothetical protein